MIAKRCLISGRVQGVYYRACTKQEASRLRLVGHARNLTDGRVEVFVVGDAQTVEAFVKWLWQGSPTSQVTAIDVEDVAFDDVEVPVSFTTS